VALRECGSEVLRGLAFALARCAGRAREVAPPAAVAGRCRKQGQGATHIRRRPGEPVSSVLHGNVAGRPGLAHRAYHDDACCAPSASSCSIRLVSAGSDGATPESNRATTFPLRSTRYFWKFQETDESSNPFNSF